MRSGGDGAGRGPTPGLRQGAPAGSVEGMTGVAASEFDARLRRTAFGMIGLLLVQFLLGISTNLYAHIPRTHPGTGPGNYLGRLGRGVGWAIGSGPGELAVHAVVGTLLVLGGFSAIALSVRARRRGWIAVTVIAALGLLGAWINGVNFIDLGQHNGNSLGMSGGFVIAVASYATGLFLPARSG